MGVQPVKWKCLVTRAQDDGEVGKARKGRAGTI